MSLDERVRSTLERVADANDAIDVDSALGRVVQRGRRRRRMRRVAASGAVAAAVAVVAAAVIIRPLHHSARVASGPSTVPTTTTTATSPADCRRLELSGTLASVSPTAFTLVVRRTSDAGRLLVGQTVAIGVDANTRVEGEGTGTLIGPNVGDQARVKALSCPGTTAGSSTLTAMSVRAHGAEHADHGGHDNQKSHK